MASARSTQPPVARTSGFGEPNCVSCHAGAVNPQGGHLSLEAPAYYVRGASYPIRVTITDTSGGRARWGFQVSARFTNGAQAGTFAAVGPNTTVLTANDVQYATHLNAPRNQPGATYSYSVMWTAPAEAGSGEIIWHAAGNAANDNAASSGDRIYTVEGRSAAPAVAETPAAPAAGLVSAATFAPLPGNQVSRGQLISIFGTRLTSGGPYGAASIPLPNSLGPTEVRVGTTLLPLVYASEGQINAQLPPDIPETGNAQFQVCSQGVCSAAAELTLQATSPGIFTLDQSGRGSGAILNVSGALVDAARPARAGDFISIYCTGLGATNPLVGAGQAVSAATPTVATVTLSIGGRPASVTYSGLAPGFVGLYQVNAVVPTGLSAGNHEILIQAGSATSRTGVTIAVQ
jgi:uncharacterized protein (TIGR03437 family)